MVLDLTGTQTQNREVAARKPSGKQSEERKNVMTGERTLQARTNVPATDRGPEEALRFPLAVVLHLLPGALLLVTALVLAPPLVERGVPYELIHIAAGLLTIVPFMFGAMLLYGHRKHGRLTLRGVVLFRRPMPLWQYAALFVPMLAFAFAALFATAPLSSFLAGQVFFWLPPYLLPSWEPPVVPIGSFVLLATPT